MTAPVRRKTARERDRELIAKAGPWKPSHAKLSVWCSLALSSGKYEPAMEAAARELNRIAKEARRG